MTDPETVANTADPRVEQHDRDGRATGGIARVIRRYAKFCIVGFSSTFIYFGVSELIAHLVHVDMTMLWPRTIVLSIGFMVSAFNGYILNRVWTFRSADPKRGRQLTKFMAIAGVGLVLSNTIVSLAMLTPIARRLGEPHGRWASMVLAIFLVSIWNFTMNQLWTFRRHHTET